MLEKLMRSEAEVKTLGVVLFENGLHLREIARRAGITPPEAKKELDNLVALGILKRERRGNQLLFNANSSSPILLELRNLYLKTEGVFGQLRKALYNLKGLKYAFIYGSIARGNFSEKSDVDILVIGDVNEEELAREVSRVQLVIGREINWVWWSQKDFSSKLKENGSFLGSLLKGKRMWLIGDKNEFERIASEATG